MDQTLNCGFLLQVTLPACKEGIEFIPGVRGLPQSGGGGGIGGPQRRSQKFPSDFFFKNK